jgi:hypothetical protein
MAVHLHSHPDESIHGRIAASPTCATSGTEARQHRRTGEGDVVAGSSPEDTPDRERRTFIRLNSPAGTALLATSPSRLKEYLDRAYRLCATGTEQFHLRHGLDTVESELGALTCRALGD